MKISLFSRPIFRQQIDHLSCTTYLLSAQYLIMKLLFCLSAVWLSACATRPFVPFALPPPSETVRVGNSALIVFTLDSADLAYTHALDGLSRAGYQINLIRRTTGGKPVTFSTQPKTIQHVAGLALQVTVDPLTKENVLGLTGRQAPLDSLGRPIIRGCIVTFMPKYVPVDSLGQPAHDSRKWKWIHYETPQGNLLVDVFWEDMRRAVAECYPSARIGYK